MDPEDIVQFFNSIGCPPQVILETPRAGETVIRGDGIIGIPHILEQYAVLYNGNPNRKATDDSVQAFCATNSITIMMINLNRGSTSEEDYVTELTTNGDDYAVIWERN